MKRTAALLTTVLLIPLVGCRAGREADRRFTVSTLGFDSVGGKLTVSAEMLIVNSENTEEEFSVEVFTAIGVNAEECMFNLSRNMSKDIQLAHCGVIAVGAGVTGDMLDGVIEYCTENREINLSAYLVSAENAETLLSGEALSALTVGYEIMGFLEHYSDETGVSYGCRVYEVQAARLKKTPVFTLPQFSLSNDTFILDGAAVYIKNRTVMDISAEEMSVYSLIKGESGKGKIYADGNVYTVKAPHIRFDSSEKGDRAEIKLNINLSPDGIDAALCDYINDCAKEILKRADGEDVFGFADRIYAENAELWRKLKNGTVTLDGADIGILCEIRRADYAK